MTAERLAEIEERAKDLRLEVDRAYARNTVPGAVQIHVNNLTEMTLSVCREVRRLQALLESAPRD